MKIKRFDELEFSILNIIELGMYSLDEDAGERAILLMKEGILVDNPKNNWVISGWKFTEEGEIYCKEFMELLRKEHGHIWMTYKDTDPEFYKNKDDPYLDRIDPFAYSEGYHNGYICKKCGYSFCTHCTPEFNVPECIRK